MSNKRILKNRSAKIKKQRAIERQVKAYSQNETMAVKLAEQTGRADGKQILVMSLSHVMSELYGWKGVRCKRLIDRIILNSQRACRYDKKDIVLFVWEDKVENAMPKMNTLIPTKYTTRSEYREAAYVENRNFAYKTTCIIALDTLCDPETYNFGTKRIDKILAGLVEEYKLMQEKDLKWFEDRCQKDVNIYF